MRKSFALGLLAATLAGRALADTGECELQLLATYPFSHRPTAEQSRALQTCDADKLYYGIGTHFNYVQARHCAFAKENHDVLMMLYANGLGVPRNYAVAKMAACRATADPVETAARLARLVRMQGGREGPSPSIDICDDASSSALLARCAANRAALEEQALDDQLEHIRTRWSSAEQEAILQVWNRAKAVGKKEALASLQAFEAGKLPAEEGTRPPKGELPPDWQAYQNAWINFGKLRYPSVTQHAWKAYFAQKRAAAR